MTDETPTKKAMEPKDFALILVAIFLIICAAFLAIYNFQIKPDIERMDALLAECDISHLTEFFCPSYCKKNAAAFYPADFCLKDGILTECEGNATEVK